MPAPRRLPRLAPPAVEKTDLPGGAFVLRSPVELGDYPRCLGDLLESWAERAPGRVFLAERAEGGDFRTLTYRQAGQQVRGLAQALLDLGAGPSRPVMLLSDNSIGHALVQLAAMHIGAPAAPISPAYSLLSQDLLKLRHVFSQLRPGVVYAEDGELFARALGALELGNTPVVCARRPPPNALELDALCATTTGTAVDQALGAVGPDTVAKVLFTSGSTGTPKGVVNTQRMLCSNQQAIRQLWPFLGDRPPVVVDWLPWSHTFGGNHNFNMVLFNGGTLYVDSGKPAPGRIDITVKNLRDVSPTLYFNVPRGFDILLPFLEQDAALRDTFFRELDLLFYAAAALPQNLWERLEAVSERARGERVLMVSAWGSTETAPLVTSVHFPMQRAGVIGLPAPGTELKMVPTDSKLEMQVKGPNITPGYWEAGGKLRPAPFDNDGFLATGDAGRLEDPEAPVKGVVFDGRTAENFKLTSGTWVGVGQLRVALIATCAPLVQDAVIAGHDRSSVGVLLFPNEAACRVLANQGADAPLADVVASAAVREGLAAALAEHNAEHPNSSMRVERALWLLTPPSIDGGEITDKGYINQRAVLERRAAEVERLFAEAPDPDVLVSR